MDTCYTRVTLGKNPWKNLGEKNEKRDEFCGPTVNHIVYDGVYRCAIPYIILCCQVWLEPSLVLYIDMNHSFI